LSYSRPAPITTVLTFLLLACSDGTVVNDDCLVDLAPITVRSKTVSVGDTMTFDASLGPAECLPADIVSEDWRWSSADTLIAKIDSLSGFFEARAPGLVIIRVEHAQNPGVASATGLHVLAE
jgi:hypothetical protein